MCCTFGDLTDVQWWRELQLPTRSVMGRDGRLLRETPDWIVTRRGPRHLRGDRRQDDVLRAGGRRRRAARRRRPRRRAGEDRSARRTSTRRATSRSRSSPAASGTSATAAGTPVAARGAARPRRRARVPAPTSCGVRYENWVDGLNGDWLDLAAAVLRRAVPGLVPRSTPTVSPTTTPRSCRPRTQLPGRPVVRRARRLHRGPARRARRLHRRPRHHGHLGHQLADPADRRRLAYRPRPVRARLPHGPAPAGPGHHPHLAVLDRGAQPPRARLAAVVDTPPSAAGSSTPTARRCRKSKGNVVTPIGLLEEHGSDAVRYWAASARLGTDAAFEVGQMKIGRRLAIKVLNASEVRAVVRRRRRAAVARPAQT